jgi:Na+-transporting NADH:ubiquinone oxidoreductase subunit B
MRFLRKLLDKQENHFSPGKKFELFFPIFDGLDTFLFTPGKTTEKPSHIRDFINLKRMMIVVVLALVPTVFMALYNTGFQANQALTQSTALISEGWRIKLISWLGIGFNSNHFFANIIHGSLYFIPVYLVTLLAGGFWEVLFAVVRKHQLSEGFLVTSLLFPLILPPTIPLWQVALGISFGVVIGKEIFGGVGMNILNPALTGRVFLFFAYPTKITGDTVWIALDGVSKATPLAELADPALNLTVSWFDAFVGLVPGSMGETSTIACLIGAAVLIITGVGSWRIMVSVLLGMVCLSLLFNILIDSPTNPLFAITPLWHLVLGGFAFGAVFMATDPVSAAMTRKGKYIYGFLIGSLAVLIRVINPAFPEGMMLAILFGNLFAPVIDKIFINANIKRRMVRSGS